MLGLPLFIAATLPLRPTIDLSTELLLALVFVLVIAVVGGRLVGAVAAIVASLFLNWFFVEPYNTLTIAEAENVISLVVFITVAVGVGALVDTVSRRSLEANRARLEAEALARSTTSLAADPEPIPRLVEHLRSTFDLDGVLLTRADSNGRVALAEAGDIHLPASATLKLSSGLKGGREDESTLEVFGRSLSADDQRLLRVLADQLALAIDNQDLAREAGEATLLADVDAVRTALLRAVSHDLRTPLASIKAMVSGLRDPTVTWTDDQLGEALLTVEEETDRLNRLVGNLLDASRLQIGTLAVNIQPASVAEIVAASLQSVNAASSAVLVEIPSATPLVLCDPVLLERSLANVISNALRHNPVDQPVRIEAAEVADAIHLRVVDRGVGIKVSERSKVVSPFQRFGDQSNGDGVGLGLSIAQGFVDAMNGVLTLDDTPGGGLTVTIALPKVVEEVA